MCANVTVHAWLCVLTDCSKWGVVTKMAIGAPGVSRVTVQTHTSHAIFLYHINIHVRHTCPCLCVLEMY